MSFQTGVLNFALFTKLPSLHLPSLLTPFIAVRRWTSRPPATRRAPALSAPLVPSWSFSNRHASPSICAHAEECRRTATATSTRPTAPHPPLTLESPRPLSPRRMLALPSPSSPPCAQKSPKPSPLSQRPTAACHYRRRGLLTAELPSPPFLAPK